MSRHEPDRYRACCARCGATDVTLAVWAGQIPCSRRIASRYRRRFETERRRVAKLIAGFAGRWMAMGELAIRLGELEKIRRWEPRGDERREPATLH